MAAVLALGACRAIKSPAPAATHEAPRVIVVGGGLAGLVSAYELGKRGIRAAVIEASERWGGRVATARYAEDTYGEYGLQEMWAHNPLLPIARELGVRLDGDVEKPYSSVVMDGQLFPYVQSTEEAYFASFLQPGEGRALRAWMASAQAVRDRALAASGLTAEMEGLEKLSFAQWVATFHLPRRASEWIRLTLECELGTDWGSFSALAGLAEMGVFLGSGEANYHVQGGNSRLVAALAAAIHGPKLLSATVTRVERWRTTEGRPRVRVTYLRDERVESLEAEEVVVTVPFFRLHQIVFEPPLSDEKWRAIRTLDRGQYTVVHLLLDRDAEKTWLVNGKSPMPVLTDGALGVVYGITHPSPPGQPLEVFSLLVHGDDAAAFNTVPREKKVSAILAALDRLWPGLSAHVRSSEVFGYHPAAIPVWPPGRSPFDRLAQSLREPELGLTLAGDYLESAHSDGAVASAQAAAARIGSALQPAALLR